MPVFHRDPAAIVGPWSSQIGQPDNMEHLCAWFIAARVEQLNSLPTAPAADTPRLQPHSRLALFMGELLCISTAAAADCHQPWWPVFTKSISI